MNLSSFEKRLNLATSVDEINNILAHELAKNHITTFAYTYYTYAPKSKNKLKYDYSTKAYRQWHKHYIAEGYEDIDTTLASVYQSSLPIFWDVETQLKEAKNNREKRLRRDSIKFGIEKGLCIPIHGPQEDFAVLLLVQMKNEHGLENFQDKQYEFLAMAYLYYFYIQKHLLNLKNAEDSYGLSKREQQCLALVAKNLPVKQIAKTLSITERTTNFHIQNLNKKLGTQNKYQSVNKAMQKRLVIL